MYVHTSKRAPSGRSTRERNKKNLVGRRKYSFKDDSCLDEDYGAIVSLFTIQFDPNHTWIANTLFLPLLLPSHFFPCQANFIMGHAWHRTGREMELPAIIMKMKNLALLFLALFFGMAVAPRLPPPPNFDPRVTAIEVLEGRMSKNFLFRSQTKTGLGIPVGRTAWAATLFTTDSGMVAGFFGPRTKGALQEKRYRSEARARGYASCRRLRNHRHSRRWHQVKLVDGPPRDRSTKSTKIPPTAHEETLMDHAQKFGIWWGLRALREVEAFLVLGVNGRGPDARAKMAQIRRPITMQDIEDVQALAFVDEDDDYDEEGFQSDEPTKPTSAAPVEILLIACASRNDLVREDATEVCDLLSGGALWPEDVSETPKQVIVCKGNDVSGYEMMKVGRGEMECKLPGGPDEQTMRWSRGSVLQRCDVADGNKWCRSWTPTDDWTDPKFGFPEVAVAEADLFGIPIQPPDFRYRGRPLGVAIISQKAEDISQKGEDISQKGEDPAELTDELRTLWVKVSNACWDPVYRLFCEVQRTIIDYVDGLEHDGVRSNDSLTALYTFIFPKSTLGDAPSRLEAYQQLLFQGAMCEQIHLALDSDHELQLHQYIRDIHGRCNQQFHDDMPNIGRFGVQLWSAMRLMAEYIKGGLEEHYHCSILKFNRLTVIPKGRTADIRFQCLGGQDPNQIIANMENCDKQDGYSWNLVKSECEGDGRDGAELFTAVDLSLWTRTDDGLKRCTSSHGAGKLKMRCSLISRDELTEREQNMVLTSGVPLDDDDDKRQRSWKDAQGTTWAWRNGSMEGCDGDNKCMRYTYPQLPYSALQRAYEAGMPGLQGVQDASRSTISCDGLWEFPQQELTQRTMNGTVHCGVALDHWWWEERCFLNNCVWDFSEVSCSRYHPYYIPPSRYASAEYAGVLPLENQRDWLRRCHELDSILNLKPTAVYLDRTKELARDKITGHCEDSSGDVKVCGGGLTWEAYLLLRRQCNGFWNRATASCLPMKIRDPEKRAFYHVDGLRRIFECPELGADVTCIWNYMTVKRGSPGRGGIYNPTDAMLKRWKEWTDIGESGIELASYPSDDALLHTDTYVCNSVFSGENENLEIRKRARPL
ncbi:hypothetical protein L249_8256 [Ophiocordyceps polyrhachis-furcata BCC 54312]|uniref:Uncharacterized protein n=1 Tax=Ophiocordyceps polyrhachis-furcata BCC 54312 TaxID=1330021 RepID=A0A367LIK7_9HYPO|nr:hypothetical protein L249_8256 [Ophiocordyceps polyrhachis-furcata BCC 54312]